VSLVGVAFAGVGLIGGRSEFIVVWNVMVRNVRIECSGSVSQP
jgi:hypothetical protein